MFDVLLSLSSSQANTYDVLAEPHGVALDVRVQGAAERKRLEQLVG